MTHRASRFRRNIASGEPGATRSDDQGSIRGVAAQGCCDPVDIIGQNLCHDGRGARIFQHLHNSGAGAVLLLAAGASLWLLLRLNPIRDAWLGTKLLLVVAYVIAGMLAMKRGRPWGTRVASLGCALLLFALIASVAATHNRSGWFGVRQ